MAINPKIRERTEKIRKEVYGKDVREALASGLEVMSEDVEETKNRQDNVESQFQNVESQFQAVLNETTGKDVISAPEVTAARVGADGTQHSNLKQRLDSEHDKITEQLSQISKEVKRVKRNYITSKKAHFCLVDDDGTKRVMSFLKPELEKRGFKGTAAVITSTIDVNPNKLTSQQLIELHNSGFEIISHSHTHPRLPDITDEQIRLECENSINFLRRLGINTKVLAYPYGLYNKRVVNIVKDYFDCAMTTGVWLNETPLKTYAIARLGVGAWGVRDMGVIKSRIDEIIEKKQLGVIMTHVGDNTPEEDNVVIQTLDYIKSLGYEVTTFSEAYEHHKNILEYGEFDESTSRFNVEVGYDGSGLDIAVKFISAPTNAFTNSSPLTDFEPYSLTVTPINTEPGTSGFPADRGILSTYYFGKSNGYQIFMVGYRDLVYHRRWRVFSEDPLHVGWTDWKPLSVDYFLDDDEIDAKTPPKYFPTHVVTYCAISYDHAQNEGFPINKKGVLITYTVGSRIDSYNRWQEYHVSGENTVFRRYAVDGSTWSDWIQIAVASDNVDNFLDDDAIGSQTPPNYFPPYKVTYCAITHSHSRAEGFPLGRQGLLITNTVGSRIHSYNRWQEFHISGTNYVFRRTALDDSTWSDWVQIAGAQDETI